VRIGPYILPARAVLAPMVGVTDRPFRVLARKMGAGLAASEMLTSDVRLWSTAKSRLRMNHEGEPTPRVVQLAGADCEALIEAARINVDLGAQIIDINMGCPAKKVCGRLCGSALMQDEALVARILNAVVRAVNVPVTLKIRTGWDRTQKNGIRIALIAEECGVAALAVHGRTRADLYNGDAEYDVIAAIKQAVNIPVLANGDVDSAHKARQVLEYTKCDGLLIGRAAQGRPWIFREIAHYLATGEVLAPPSAEEVCDILCGHLEALYAFYGELQGVRMARKHLGWYARDRPQHSSSDPSSFRSVVNRAESALEQLRLTRDCFNAIADNSQLRIAA